MKINKKGISPLIATVLLIGFTIVLAALVITWGGELFRKTTKNTGETYDFSLLCTTKYNLEYSAKRLQNNQIEVTAKNNNEYNIYGFLFIVRSADGKAETFTTDENVVKGTRTSPYEGSAVLLNFQTLTFTLTPPNPADWKFLEARPIGILESGQKKVCENEYKITIQ